MSSKEPPIPPLGVEQQEPIEETTDTELPSTKDIQPPLSGMSSKEPPIPPLGVEQQEPIEETTDTELPSTKDIQPPLV
nr:hypothetical protein [Tanacetum cinerariifolium]